MKRAAWLLVLASCAARGPSQNARLARDSDLEAGRDPAGFDAAPAVALVAEDGTRIVHRGNAEFYTQKIVHRAFCIQTEEGFALADVRILVPPRAELMALRARYRKPGGGAFRELDPRDVIVDESAGDDPGRIANARLFRFPDVQVGSILEWSYVLELQQLETDDEAQLPGDFPVRRWVAWVETTRDLELDVRSYNAPPPRIDELVDEDWRRWTVTTGPVPHRPPEEAFAPHPTFTQPRLAFRVVRFNPEVQGRFFSYPVLPEWKDVFGRWVYAAYDAEQSLFSGFRERLDVSGCTTVYCRLQRAHGLVNARTRYSGIGSWLGSSRLVEVLASRQATGFERMLLLKGLLDGASVASWPGSYTARNSEVLDLTFPSLDHLNRPVLYVPRQAGLDTELWVDPLCESCDPGVVSAEARGMRAKVFDVKGHGDDGRPDVSVYEAVVNGGASAASFRTRQYEAVVMQNGNVELTQRDERSGRLAVDFCSGEDEDPELTARALHVRVQRLSASAQATGAIEGDCDVAHARAWTGFKAVLPRHAVFDGPALLVPLTLLEPDWRGTFDEDARELPIAFAEGDRTLSYVLKLRAPPGWVLATKAVSQTAIAPGLTATWAVQPAVDGAEVSLTVKVQASYHPATMYPSFRQAADFIRSVRMRVLELRRPKT